jgi:tetratricopeptide (TPR) repeat protein
LYFHQGKFQEALDVANRAKTMDPKAPSSYCNAGQALFGLGRYDEALTDLSKSIEMDPTVCAGEDYFYRAKTYEKLGKTDLAEKDRDSAKKLGFVSDDN